MPPQPLAAFDTTSGDTSLDAALSQITHGNARSHTHCFARTLARPTVQVRYRRNCIKRGLECHRILSLGSSDRDSQWDAACIYARCIVSIRACCGPLGWGRFPGPSGAGDAGSIEARALPIDPVVFTQPTQHRQIKLMPYALRLPISQTSPARHAAAETQLLREVFPRGAGLQHIPDAVERDPVIDRAPPIRPLGDGVNPESAVPALPTIRC